MPCKPDRFVDVDTAAECHTHGPVESAGDTILISRARGWVSRIRLESNASVGVLIEEKYLIDETYDTIFFTHVLVLQQSTVKKTVLCARGLNYEQPSLGKQGAQSHRKLSLRLLGPLRRLGSLAVRSDRKAGQRGSFGQCVP